jgi:hypothetical protein
VTVEPLQAYAAAAFDPDFDHQIFVAGDDGMLIMKKEDYHPDFRAHFTKTLEDLGLIPDVQVAFERHEVEFCSKLAWQGSLPDGTTQTVFGAKLGRAIHRFGWNTTVPGALNLYGACVSVGRDNHHVPLVAAFADHMRSLIPKKESKIKGSEWGDLHVSRQWRCVHANYDLIQKRYGLTYEQVQDVIAAFTAVKALPAVISHPSVLRMVEVDHPVH